MRSGQNMAIKIISKKAFSLMELLIVIVLLGIVATFAMPQYNAAIEQANAARGK